MPLSRRLSPLVMGVVALVLMVAILPSSLHLPITGPPGSAEVAPVPGKAQAGANLSQLGLADSGTVGTGGGSAAADGGATAAADSTLPGQGAPPDPNAPRSQCYGNPPRQTEDPLSPPCRQPWKGNNGGATSPGVTDKSIQVLLYSNLPVQPTWYNDTSNGITASDSKLRRTLKSLIRYFSTRYVTYGRQVQLIEQVNAFGAKPSIEAQDALQQGPFAVMAQPAYGSRADYAGYMDVLASHHVITLYGWSEGGNGNANEVSRDFLATRAPYVYNFQSDRESQQASTAQWICNQLIGHPAVHAGDPTLAQKPRRIGILYDQAQPAMKVNAQLLVDDIKQGCGVALDQFGTPDTIGNTSALEVTLEQMRQGGVTSVFLESASSNPAIYSDKLTPRYAPEWLFNDDSDGGLAFTARANPPDQWNHAFGVTWRWRARQMPETYWNQAYSSVNPDGQFDRWFGAQIYEQMLQLFSGIQMAGPNLNPTTFRSGLQSYRRFATDGNHSPTAFFAPGNYSFLQDMEIERWSATGLPPGGADPSPPTGNSAGCYLDLNEGARIVGSAWPKQDQSNDPGTCSADWNFYSDANADASSATQQ